MLGLLPGSPLYDVVALVTAIVVGYFIGATPFSFLVARMRSIKDIRKLGSGNVGATNVMRNGGFIAGVIAFALDMLKGMVPVWIHLHERLPLAPEYALEAGIASVIGHMRPTWLNFVGGKGVATLLGVLSAINPHMGLTMAASWLLVFYLFRYSSLASLTALVATACTAFIFLDFKSSWKIAAIVLLIIYKHKDNILRFIRGEEKTMVISLKGSSVSSNSTACAAAVNSPTEQ